jgi:hypothetical protein
MKGSRGRTLRPVFEWILLVGSVLAGLGVIGSCAVGVSSSAGAGSVALNVVGGLIFATFLVGAVYLLTTMSRDLRALPAMDHANGEPRAPRPLESRIRRGLELLFLGVTLFVGVVVVGGCGVGSVVGFGQETGVPILLGLLAGGVLVVGVVYLATSMSRDVRMLKATLQEQDERSRREEQR